MSTDEMAFVIIDDTDISIRYNNPDHIDRWYGSVDDVVYYAYNKTQHHPLAIGRFNLSIEFVFDGHSFAMFGVGPSINPGNDHTQSQLAITIDANTSNSLQLHAQRFTTRIYQQFFQSPILSDGKHTVLVTNPDWDALDFILVGVGQDTNLDGKTLWIDNEDPQIQYSGTSCRRNTKLMDGNSIPAYTAPVGNSTHDTSIPGDLLSFAFYGTAVSLYGTYSWKNVSGLSFVFTLDDVVLPVSFFVTDFMLDHIDQKADTANFLLFEAKNLAAAPHTLIVNLTRVENTTFRFDYLTYKPAFSTLATMPDLSLGPVPADPSFTGAALPMGTDKQRLRPGTLAAAVTGSLLLLFLSIGLAYYVTRRYKSKTSKMKVLPFSLPSEEGDLPPPYQRKQAAGVAFGTLPAPTCSSYVASSGPPPTGDTKTSDFSLTASSEIDTSSLSHYDDMRRSP